MDTQAAQAQVLDGDVEDLVRIPIPDHILVLDHLVEQVPLKAVPITDGGVQAHQVHLYQAVPQVRIPIPMVGAQVHIQAGGAQAQDHLLVQLTPKAVRIQARDLVRDIVGEEEDVEEVLAVPTFLLLVLHHLEVDLVTEVPAQSQVQDQDLVGDGDVEEDLEAAQAQEDVVVMEDGVGGEDGLVRIHISDQEVMALLVF